MLSLRVFNFVFKLCFLSLSDINFQESITQYLLSTYHTPGSVLTVFNLQGTDAAFKFLVEFWIEINAIGEMTFALRP